MSPDPPATPLSSTPVVPASHEGAAIVQPSASYSIVIRARLPQRPGAFGQVATTIGNTGAILGAIDLVRVEKSTKVRDITVSCIDAAHGERVVDAVREIDGVTVESVLDRTFQMHQGGKIEVKSTVPVKTRDDLSMAYTPGVARVCSAIHDDVERAWALTIKGNTVAVISDGTAVLGLGDIGPEAAMPVMEGKALLFKEFAGVDAFRSAWTPPMSTRSSASSGRWRPRSAPSTWRTSPRRAASRSSGGCARSSTSRCSMTTSTEPRSSFSRRCSTLCAWSASAWRTRGSS